MDGITKKNKAGCLVLQCVKKGVFTKYLEQIVDLGVEISDENGDLLRWKFDKTTRSSLVIFRAVGFLVEDVVYGTKKPQGLVLWQRGYGTTVKCPDFAERVKTIRMEREFGLTAR